MAQQPKSVKRCPSVVDPLKQARVSPNQKTAKSSHQLPRVPSQDKNLRKGPSKKEGDKGTHAQSSREKPPSQRHKVSDSPKDKKAKPKAEVYAPLKSMKSMSLAKSVTHPLSVGVQVAQPTEREIRQSQRQAVQQSVRQVSESNSEGTAGYNASHEPFKRRIVIVRHGERLDAAFGKGMETGWVTRAFDHQERYIRFDINLPGAGKMKRRPNNKSTWCRDPDLTQTGHMQAILSGRALAAQNIKIDRIITSPSLRCVRTVEGLLTGYNKAQTASKHQPHLTPVAVDPGLFEWGYFAKGEGALPKFMTPEELQRQCHVNVDPNYRPYMKTAQLNINELLPEFSGRCGSFVKHVVNNCKDQTILLSTHAPNFEPMLRYMIGKPSRTWDEVKMPMRLICYLSMVSLLERPDGKWDIAGAPVPCLRQSGMTAFNLDQYLKLNV